MAVVGPLLIKATIPDVTGIAADAAVNQFAFGSADVAGCLAAVKSFYVDANTTKTMAAYHGKSRTTATNGWLLQAYDLNLAMHGEPHGTPVATLPFTGVPDNVEELPLQVAAVLSYHAIVSALPEHGPVAVRATAESAIDSGAPATHGAKTRPRASLRGRIYLGPLAFAASANNGELNPQFVVDCQVALHRLHLAVTGAWAVWSRTYGTMTSIEAGWINQQFGTVRRRRLKAVTKIVWT